MRYRYNVPLPVRRMVEYQLEGYSKLKMDIALRKAAAVPSPTQAYSMTAGCQTSHGNSRPTEEIALQICADPYIVQGEAIVRAIDSAMGRDPLTDSLVRDVYLRPDRVSVEAAAVRHGMPTSTAYYRITNRIGEIAIALGYIPAQ